MPFVCAAAAQLLLLAPRGTVDSSGLQAALTGADTAAWIANIQAMVSAIDTWVSSRTSNSALFSSERCVALVCT